MKIPLILMLLLTGSISMAQTIYVIPTIHKMHKENVHYNYDSLRSIIHRLQPDIIAIEIREEDIEQDTLYLQKSYPYEMWMAQYWFPDIKIEGFDWLGEEIEGKPIPEDYFKELELKKLQQRLSKDTAAISLLQTCTEITQQRLPYFKERSLKDLLEVDPELARSYYDCLESQLRTTEYYMLVEFYEARNANMVKRLKKIIKDNPGKIIVVLTGADHYYYIDQHLEIEELPFSIWKN